MLLPCPIEDHPLATRLSAGFRLAVDVLLGLAFRLFDRGKRGFFHIWRGFETNGCAGNPVV
jgi:hypothetical protein